MVSEFAEIIKSIVNGSNSPVLHLPAVTDDPQQRRPDISRAKKYIDWEPKVCLFSYVVVNILSLNLLFNKTGSS